MNFWRKITGLVVLIIVSGIMVGCATSRHYSSSVVQYLYPDQSEPVESPEIPVLSLPLKVGIAFVPGATEKKYIMALQIYQVQPVLMKKKKCY